MNIEKLLQKIQDARSVGDGDRALLVGISGIDASGKGYIAKEVADGLKAAGHRVALINVDGWRNTPHVRFLPALRSSSVAKSQMRLRKLSAEETVAAYHTIYFPARVVHFAIDDPKAGPTSSSLTTKKASRSSHDLNAVRGYRRGR